MKKIAICIVFVTLVFLNGRVFSAEVCTNSCQPGETQLERPACTCIPGQGTQGNGQGTPNGGGNTPAGDNSDGGAGLGGGSTVVNDGMNISTECLLGREQCTLNVYKEMGIRKSNENPTVLGFFQDITYASTTVALGTVLVLAMVIGGLSWSFASITGKDTKKGKTILISSFVGMLMVLGSYAIVRLIQFLALAGS